MNAPDISAFPSNTIHETKAAVLHCHTKSTENVNYTWYKDNEILPWVTQQKVLLATNRTDTGSYKCNTENRFGRRNSTDLFFLVNCECCY